MAAADSAACKVRMVSLVTLRYLDSNSFDGVLPVAASFAFVVRVDGNQEGRRLVHNRVQNCVQVLVGAVECGVAIH